MKLPPFDLEVIFERYEHQRDMLVLGASDASNLSVQELFDLCNCTADLTSIRLKYGDVRGELSLREAVAKTYLTTVTPEQVLITIGASEAIFLAIEVLVEAGDRVLVCNPAYQPLATLAAAKGAVIETYDYLESANFVADVHSIVTRLHGSAPFKLLIINTPHNPTGQAFSEAEMLELLKAARDAGTTVLVDEVFNGSWHGSTTAVPSAITMDQNVVVIGSLSKVYGLSGLRIGWLAGPMKIIGACRHVRHYTTIAPPLVVQELGAIAVEHRDKVLDRTRLIVAQNRTYINSWLEDHKDVFNWVEPMAGLVMLLKLEPQVDTSEFVDDLAQGEKVFLIPCRSTFGMPEGYLRLGLGTDHQALVTGLERLSKFVRRKF